MALAYVSILICSASSADSHSSTPSPVASATKEWRTFTVVECSGLIMGPGLCDRRTVTVDVDSETERQRNTPCRQDQTSECLLKNFEEVRKQDRKLFENLVSWTAYEGSQCETSADVLPLFRLISMLGQEVPLRTKLIDSLTDYFGGLFNTHTSCVLDGILSLPEPSKSRVTKLIADGISKKTKKHFILTAYGNNPKYSELSKLNS